ncbi:MAG: ACT domain-containing protein [Syntrophomonadaceae bacterium]|jgi:hypothetical protein|nr:ACT domain-containing protein [Syntrophomonadaceae bacterium]
MAKQISIFLENKSGKLSQATRVLGDAGINIRAFTIADTSDFGILRIIVNDPDRANTILKTQNFTVSVTEVIAVQLPDTPGSLADIIEAISQENLNIEYLYAFVGSNSSDALVIFKVDDIEKAKNALRKKDIKYLEDDQLYQI